MPKEFPLDPVGSDDLLFFGRIHPDKGTAEAIEVARRAGRALHIYGIVQDAAYHEQEVVPHVDGKAVIFHGPVGGKARIAALGKAHALLHIINFDEPFGLSVIEAMACGTPVIAQRRGSMPELIDDGVNGFLVDGIEAAVAAVGKIAALDRGQVSESIARRFSVGRMADEYIALYEHILAVR